ncbi:MAG: AmmeMemoRadiSam system protein A [Patescibacteria group bacterium]
MEQINKPLSGGERGELLELARGTIGAKLRGEEFFCDDTGFSEVLKEKRACFVTLTVRGRLRGCIGHVLPVQALYKDVIENAQAAAFEDPRFFPLDASELPDLEIEISVLSVPEPLQYHDTEELIHYLAAHKPGVILKKNRHQATFLPQVWEQIAQPEEFLSELCMKASLAPDEWKKEITIHIYYAEHFTQS